MAKDIEALLYDADLIHDANQLPKEEAENFNSAERVGQMFIDIIEHLRDVSDHNGTPGVGGDVPSGQYGSLISSLWTRSNPGSLAEGETGKILEWNGSAWQYSSTPTGGGGTPGTGGLAWSDLAANDGALPSTKQIDGSHLLSALSGYLPISELTKQDSKFTWWGQRMQNISGSYVVKGAMINVDSLTFTNGIKLTPESSNGQYYLKLSYAGNGTDTAHFYATGGVSALGMGSVSPGGGGSGVELAGILKHISENDDNNAESISPQQGATIRWGGTSQKWVIDKTAITDIAGISAPASTGYLKATVSGNNISYSWENITPGTGSINKLSDVGDVTVNPYPTSSTNDTGILAWLTGQHLWGYLKFNVAGTGTGTTRTLSSITFADTTYNVPEAYSLPNATTSTKGGVIVGTGLSVNDGTVSVNTSTIATKSSVDALSNAVDGLDDDITAISNKFSTNKTAWGQPYLSNGTFLSPTDSITVTIPSDRNSDSGNNHKGIIVKKGNITSFYLDAMSATNSVIRMVGDNIIDYVTEGNNGALNFGYGSRKKVATSIFGSGINFKSLGDDNGVTTFQLTTAGQAHLINSTHEYTSGLRIGNAVLYCDASGNLALKSATGEACNFYATGGVSALGMSSGSGSVSVGAMTFGEVNITNKIKFNGNNDLCVDYVTVEGETIMRFNSPSNGGYSFDNKLVCTEFYVGEMDSPLKKIEYKNSQLQFTIGNQTYKVNATT